MSNVYLRAVSWSTSSMSTPRVDRGCKKAIWPDTPCLGVLSTSSHASGGKQVQLVLKVFDLKADMVDGLAMALYETGDGPIRICGLDELQLGGAHADQGEFHPLVGDLLDL